MSLGSFGGWSYGYRYLIPIIPILLFFVPQVRARGWVWPLAGLVLLSGALALIGAYHPWPPVHEPEGDPNGTAARVTNPVGGNLSAWLNEFLPASSVTARAAGTFIHGDARQRHDYLTLFYHSKGDVTMAREQRRRPVP